MLKNFVNKRTGWLIYGTILFHLLLTIFISHYSLTIYPNTGDEASILFQSKIFSLFKLTAETPKYPILYNSHYLLFVGNKWFGVYPPIWPLMISVGQFFKIPLISVSIYSSMSLILLYLLLKRIFQNRILSLVFCFIFSLSPTFLFHASSYYNHIGALLIFLFILLFFFDFLRCHSLHKAILISLFFGLGVGIRPYTFFLLGTALCPFLLTEIIKSKQVVKNLLAITLPFIFLLLVLLLYNYNQTSSFLNFSYLSAGHNNMKLSFNNFNLLSLERLIIMFKDTTRWLFGFGYFHHDHLKWDNKADINLGVFLSGASFCFLLWKVFFAKLESLEAKIFHRISLLSVCLLIGGHIFYNFRGGRFGERYFFEITWIILFYLIYMIYDVTRKFKQLIVQNTAFALILVLILSPSWAYYLPNTIKFFHKENSKRMDLFLKTKAAMFKNAVIHIASVSEFDPFFHIRNDPDLRGTIYVLYHPQWYKKILEEYPNRDHYVYIYNQIKKKSHFVSIDK